MIADFAALEGVFVASGRVWAYYTAPISRVRSRIATC